MWPWFLGYQHNRVYHGESSMCLSYKWNMMSFLDIINASQLDMEYYHLTSLHLVNYMLYGLIYYCVVTIMNSFSGKSLM